jgi:hypothetical protein
MYIIIREIEEKDYLDVLSLGNNELDCKHNVDDMKIAFKVFKKLLRRLSFPRRLIFIENNRVFNLKPRRLKPLVRYSHVYDFWCLASFIKSSNLGAGIAPKT